MITDGGTGEREGVSEKREFEQCKGTALRRQRRAGQGSVWWNSQALGQPGVKTSR